MIKLNLDNKVIELSGQPGIYQQPDLTIEVRPASHGVNTKGVQDLIILRDKSKSVLHLSSGRDRHAISDLDGQLVTASRVY
jgi:hypothetical protein